VLAGKDRASLAAEAVIADSGFESSTTLPDRQAYVAVQALDARGRVLATSPTARVVSYASALRGQAR
jgi:hypothetical protein